MLKKHFLYKFYHTRVYREHGKHNAIFILIAHLKSTRWAKYTIESYKWESEHKLVLGVPCTNPHGKPGYMMNDSTYLNCVKARQRVLFSSSFSSKTSVVAIVQCDEYLLTKGVQQRHNRWQKHENNCSSVLTLATKLNKIDQSSAPYSYQIHINSKLYTIIITEQLEYPENLM